MTPTEIWKLGQQARAGWSIVSIEDDIVLIKDEGGPVSITNDAEAVVAAAIDAVGFTRSGGLPRIHYIDSMGNRDELCHVNGRFTGFAPVQRENRNL